MALFSTYFDYRIKFLKKQTVYTIYAVEKKKDDWPLRFLPLILQVSNRCYDVISRCGRRCEHMLFSVCVSEINHKLPTGPKCISVSVAISLWNLGQHFNLPPGAETRPRTAQKVHFCCDSTVGSLKIALWLWIQRWFFLHAPFVFNILYMGSAWKLLQSLVMPVSLHDHTEEAHICSSDLPEEEEWRKQGGEEERARVYHCTTRIGKYSMWQYV